MTSFRIQRPLPALLVIMSLERVEALRLGDARSDDSTDELEERMLAVDYSQNFVVFVSEGPSVIGLPPIQVLSVTRRLDTVTVEAHFPEREVGMPVPDMGVTPYTAISVSREGEWGRDFRFILEADDQQVHEHTAFVP